MNKEIQMKKGFMAILIVIVGLLANACTYAGDEGDTNNFYGTNPINVYLSANSPSGEIAPGNNRVLGKLTFNSKNPEQLHGLDLEVVDNYASPDFQFVWTIWIEDENGNLVYEPKDVYDGFNFWGVYNLPVGESTLVVKGRVTFGEPFDSEWNPRPEFKILINGIYATETVFPAVGLMGNVLFPKYTGSVTIESSLADDSPSGIMYEGSAYTLYKFKVWASQGDFLFTNPGFEITNFDGDLQGCTFWEGNTLLSTQFTVYDAYNKYLQFEDEDAEHLLITTTPRTFSLVCQFEVNSDNQTVQVHFAGGHFETGPSGMSTCIKFGPWSDLLTFINVNTLQVSKHWENPNLIIPGVNVTLLKFDMLTSAGDAALYSLPFTFRNWQSNVFTNCEIQDKLGNTKNKGISGYNPGNGDLYLTFFFGPSTGDYPGDSYDFTWVTGGTWNTFQLVCDVAPSTSMQSTVIELQGVSVYQGYPNYYRILPDTTPLLSHEVHQL